MGLDMYLIKKEKVVREEVMYWRKANHIREWFNQHLEGGCENCVEKPVTKEMLENLIKDCEIVLNYNAKAEELLPTAPGFFFGSTEYDVYYFEDLKDTIKGLKEVIANTDWENEEITYDEWW